MSSDWKTTLPSILILSLTTASLAEAQSRIDLAGQWQVRLAPNDEYNPATANRESLDDSFQPVQLPGALRDSGLGDPVGPNTHWIGGLRAEYLQRPAYKKYLEPSHFKMPFWLQPERHYVGPAYYRRAVDIPESWNGKRVLLTLERPHWQTQVWVDGKLAGNGDSLSTPHEYDLTEYLSPGRHSLIIRVDNSLESLDVGLNSHSVSDHTQTAWHGIVGNIELRAEPRIAVNDVQVYPAADARSARIVLQLANTSGTAQDETVTFRASQNGKPLGQRSLDVTAQQAKTTVDCILPFDHQAERWDEFHPNLCQLQASLVSDETGAASRQVVFGVRHITTSGTQFLLNDRPLFLRGTLECCIFPLTGYPPTDGASWKRILRICKSHGLNHIRFHSWCPPKAAFVAADELGFYFQVECSTWPNQSTSLGNGRPIDQWLYREGERVLAEYGNHPSFLLLAMGNEPAGPQQGGKYLGPWVEHFKAKTDRQLVTSASGWPSISANEFHVTPKPRIQQWGQGLRSRINAQPPATMVDYREFVNSFDVPVISHEIGQWCVYPNFREMEKYTGSLKPRNFEIFRDLLRDAGMLDQADDFLMASGKLQTLCYKEEIESALRTPGFGGFQLLDLHDFPGQGTALVGVLDPFWDSKPYVTPGEFSHFCGPTTPLARIPKRSWTSDETFAADIEICHYGPKAIRGAAPRWSLHRGDEIIDSGNLSSSDVPAGQLTLLGRVEVPLGDVEGPTTLVLRVSLQDGGQEYANDWKLWIYPARLDRATPNNVLLAHNLDDEATDYLKQGGTVVLCADPNRVKSDVQIGFSSIFWNTAWTNEQAPHTLGILCDPDHPAFAHFPTDYHSDWQWWSIISRSKPMLLDALPCGLRPLVQVVPDWFRPLRLGLVFEAKVGQGKLLACSIDLNDDMQARPAARQLRHSLLQYAASDDFAPKTTVSLEAIHDLFREPSLLQRLRAEVIADSSHPDYPATNVIDGDPKTIWHTNWETPSPMPHSLVIDLGQAQTIQGLRYLPRQDMTNGRICEYEIHVSSDGQQWGDAVLSGVFPSGAAPQIIQLPERRSARFIRLTALQEVNGKPFASAAEIDVLLAD